MQTLQADIVTEPVTDVAPLEAADLDAMSDPPDQAAPSTDAPGEDEQAQREADLALAARIEALLVSTDRPLGDARLAELLEVPGRGSGARLARAIALLNESYGQTGRAFRIERVAGGWQMLTQPEHGPLLSRLHADRQTSRLSQAAMETLSIIAYRQPIMRAELEAIRGVASGEVLRGLLDRRLVKIVGRAEELGRPMLYGTTREFLKVFGLASLDDLPAVEGLERRAMPARPASAPADSTLAEDEAAPDTEDTSATDPPPAADA